MRQIIFSYNREILNFIIRNREIFYSDRRWKNWIRCVPPPENLLKIIMLSRNRIPRFLAEMFKFTKEEIDEYNAAQDEEALAQIIIRDAKSKGCILVKNSEETVEEVKK